MNKNILEILKELLNLDFKREVKPVFSQFSAILTTLSFAFLYFFFTLPALNFQSPQFYTYLIIVTAFYLFINVFFAKTNKTIIKVSLLIIAISFVLPSILSIISSPLFRAKSYANLISVKDGVFSEDVKEITLDQVPIVDREAAVIIGSKQMGVMTDLVSQFEIDENYSQINIKGKPVRVSPLKYSDVIKYIGNYKNGIPRYVSVDMTSQEAKVVRLKKPIKYSKSDYLFRNIHRHIRFKYPFHILANTNFELDDEGNAYYVTPVITKRIGFFRGEDIKSVIITDAHSGDSKEYSIKNAPKWVDRVFPASFIIKQLNHYGKYQDGFFNTLFSQRNVKVTSNGYNYVSIGEDIYLTTGVTSIRSDESNLGFYYVNLRTKEAKFYSVPSATETAAMESARGKVQEKNYNPTFPVLLNLSNRPVYFISLKDRAKIAKMFALVDAQQFKTVYVSESVDKLVNDYMNQNSTDTVKSDKSEKKTIEIEKIEKVVVNSNTIIFIKATGEKEIYIAKGENLIKKLIFKKPDDIINILVNKTKNEYRIIEVE